MLMAYVEKPPIDELYHYGVGHLDGGNSGRYAWGSGKEPYQNSGDFLARVEELRKKNYEFYSSSPTNQIFIIMENEKLAELEEKVGLSIWGVADENRTIVRFVISWATTKEEVEALIDLM